jgi:hypothetical protein
MIAAIVAVLSLLSPGPGRGKLPAEKVWANPDVEALESYFLQLAWTPSLFFRDTMLKLVGSENLEY